MSDSDAGMGKKSAMNPILPILPIFQGYGVGVRQAHSEMGCRVDDLDTYLATLENGRHQEERHDDDLWLSVKGQMM